MHHSMIIGLDVHKATISVAVAEGKRGGDVRSWGVIPNRADEVKVIEKLSGRDRSFIICHATVRMRERVASRRNVPEWCDRCLT